MLGSRTNKAVVARLFAACAGLCVIAGLIVWLLFLHHADRHPEISPAASSSSKPRREIDEQAFFIEARHRMVEVQLQGRDITDRRVLDVMSRVPRQSVLPVRFVPMTGKAMEGSKE